MKDSLPSSLFLVDASPDPREARRAVRGLKAMQKLGRLAEKALAELAETGHFDTRAPWLAPTTYGKKYVVRYSRFPSLPSLSRQDVPGYGRVRISVGRTPFTEKYGGFERDCLDVVAVLARPNFAGRLVESEFRVGYVRLNVGGHSFYPSHFEDGEKSRSVVLLRTVKAYSVRNVAKVLAEAAAGPGFKKDPLPSVYYASLTEWLVKDGWARQFLSDLRDAVDGYRTVSRIMTG